MARYVIETKQIDGGVWLDSGAKTDTARSKIAAIKLCEEHAEHFFCPKRVIDTKTGEVIHTVGDDEHWNHRSERLTKTMRTWQALDVAFKALQGQIVPVETMTTVTLRITNEIEAAAILFLALQAGKPIRFIMEPLQTNQAFKLLEVARSALESNHPEA